MSELNGKNLQEVIAQGKLVIFYTGNKVVTDVRDLRICLIKSRLGFPFIQINVILLHFISVSDLKSLIQ